MSKSRSCSVASWSVAEPRFARVRAGILKLPATARPFEPIESARGLYGDGTAGFAPTKAEFIAGTVRRSDIARSVQTRLLQDGWAYIEGHGAAGKTVLCTLLALEWAGTLSRPSTWISTDSERRR